MQMQEWTFFVGSLIRRTKRSWREGARNPITPDLAHSTVKRVRQSGKTERSETAIFRQNKV